MPFVDRPLRPPFSLWVRVSSDPLSCLLRCVTGLTVHHSIARSALALTFMDNHPLASLPLKLWRGVV